MSSIDTRVVEMKFDNAQFERGIKGSLDSLDKLKAGLKLDGAKGALDGLSASASRFSLAGIADSVQNIASKFSVMGAIGFTVIQSITNGFLGLGKSMLGAITGPLIEGGQKRALAIEQAKFQFKGLGMDVNKTMESALAAVKGTSFGLDDAAKAAAMFGASGMKAGADMTGALRGIAGVAAMSGSSYADVADVFTKVAGQGRLMGDDLNRLASRGVNAAATLGKSMGKTEAQVREMVTAGKIDFMTFSKAMDSAFGEHATKASETYAGALANMKAAMARIGAQFFTYKFEAMRRVLNALTPVIDAVAGALKPFIDMFGKNMLANADRFASMLKMDGVKGALTPIIPLIAGFKNILSALFSVIQPIKAAFREIFPPATMAQLVAMAISFENFTRNLILSTGAADKVKRVFAGVFAIFSIGWQVIKAAASMFRDLFAGLTRGGGGIGEFAAKIGDFFVAIDQGLKNGDLLQRFFGNLGDILYIPIRLFRSLVEVVGSFFGKLGGIDTGGVSSRFGALSKLFSSLGQSFENLSPTFQRVLGVFKSVADFLGRGLKQLWTAVTSSFTNVNFGRLLDSLNTGLFAGIVLLIKKFVDNLSNLTKGGLDGGLMKTIKGTFGEVTNTFKTMQGTLKAATLLEIAAAIGIITISVVALSKIDPAKLSAALAAIAVMIGELSLAMLVLSKIPLSNQTRLIAMGASLILLAIAIDILASAVKKLAALSWNDLAKGLVGVTVLLAALIATVNLMPNEAKLIGAAAGLVILALAIKLLVGSVTDLSGLSWGDLLKGLSSVGLLLGALTLFTKFSEANKGAVAQGAGLLILAVAIKVLASAVKDFAAMSWQDLAKGLTSITAILGVFAAFSVATGGGLSIIGAATSLVIVSGAMKILGGAMAAFATISWEGIAKGMVSMGGALLIIGAALILIPPSSVFSAAALVAVAAALSIISGVMATLGTMSWVEIAKGLVVLAGSLLIIAVAMNAMVTALPGALALSVVAASLLMLAPALLAFGNMSIADIGKSLLMLAGVFVVIGLAGIVLTPLIPTLLALGVAIGLIGLATLLAGAGVFLFASGITMLAVSGVAATAAVVGIVGGLIALIPNLMKAIGDGVVAFAKVIAMSGPAITQAIVTVLTSLIKAINTLAPQIVSTLLRLVTMLVSALLVSVPKLVDAGMRLIIGILTGIRNNIGQIVSVAADIIVKFLNGISSALPRIIQAGVSLIISFINGVANAIRSNSGQMGAAGGNLASAIVQGMVNGIRGGIGSVVNAAKQMASDALNAAKNFLGINSPSKKFMEIGSSTGEGMVLGINNYSPRVERASEEMGAVALKAMSKSISGIADLMGTDINLNPTITPILDLTDVQKSASQIGSLLDTKPIAVSGAYASTQAASASYQAYRAASTSPDVSATAVPTSDVTFIQNNNSPKALSSSEIYRQTKNQLSLAKGAL